MTDDASEQKTVFSGVTSEAFEGGFERAFALLETAIENKRIPGGVLGIIDHTGKRNVRSVGHAQLTPTKRDMTSDTWFDLASLTKVIFTTPHILKLAQEGVIDLDAPLTTALPDLRQYESDAWDRKVTFRQCLGHLTAFPAVEPIYTYGRDAELLRTFVLQRKWPAGAPVYSDINFILLGLALERLRQKTIWEMDPGPGFSFSADPDKSAATELCTWRHHVLCGEVHDDNCAALAGAGHAGLFGSAGSVLDYAEALLEGALAEDPSVALMRQPLCATRSHGWELPHSGWSGGEKCGPDVIGHTGFTGTGLWVDFERGFAWTLLTNRVHPTRHFDSGIFALRSAVGDCLSDI
jgi:CubicO group peptidase (beta-lactamase class C family)